MGGSKNKAYDSAIADKANTKLARRLRDLITDPHALAKHLGCTIQAVNQYKQGTAYPKTENLIKIADFYDISVDYLLGISDVRSRDTDLQAACKYSGLSQDAMQNLHDFMGSVYHPLTKKWCDFLFTSNTFIELSCELASYASASVQLFVEKWKEEKNEKNGVHVLNIWGSPSEAKKGSAGWHLLKCAYAMTDAVDDSFKDGVLDYITEIPMDIIRNSEEFEEFNAYVKRGRGK